MHTIPTRSHRKKKAMATTPPVPRRQTRDAWTTVDELAFLRKLGTHQQERALPDHGTLLRRYLSAMVLRATWGKIDSAIISASIRQMLALEETRSQVLLGMNPRSLSLASCQPTAEAVEQRDQQP